MDVKEVSLTAREQNPSTWLPSDFVRDTTANGLPRRSRADVFDPERLPAGMRPGPDKENEPGLPSGASLAETNDLTSTDDPGNSVGHMPEQRGEAVGRAPVRAIGRVAAPPESVALPPQTGQHLILELPTNARGEVTGFRMTGPHPN